MVNNTTVDVSWNSAPNADGYTIAFADSELQNIYPFDLGDQTSVSLDLREGAAYYVAVAAYNNETGYGPLSNIEFFSINQSPPDD